MILVNLKANEQAKNQEEENNEEEEEGFDETNPVEEFN
jgi:hypothetical protein